MREREKTINATYKTSIAMIDRLVHCLNVSEPIEQDAFICIVLIYGQIVLKAHEINWKLEYVVIDLRIIAYWPTFWPKMEEYVSVR